MNTFVLILCLICIAEGCIFSNAKHEPIVSCQMCDETKNLSVQYIPDPYTGFPLMRSIACPRHLHDSIWYHTKPFNIFYHARNFQLTKSQYYTEARDSNVTCSTCGKVLTSEMLHGIYINGSGIEHVACETCWLADIKKNWI
jgi:ribosomal protein S27E